MSENTSQDKVENTIETDVDPRPVLVIGNPPDFVGNSVPTDVLASIGANAEPEDSEQPSARTEPSDATVTIPQVQIVDETPAPVPADQPFSWQKKEEEDKSSFNFVNDMVVPFVIGFVIGLVAFGLILNYW